MPIFEYRLVLDGPRGRYIWTGFPSGLADKLDRIPVPMDYVWHGLKLWLRERVVTDSTPERGDEVLSWLDDPETSVEVDELVDGKLRRSLAVRLPVRSPRTPDLPFGPLPRVHERERATVEAQRELNEFLEAWRVRHALTSAETSLCVSNALRAFASRLVAVERRPSPPEPK